MMNPVILIALPLLLAFLSILVKKQAGRLVILAAGLNLIALLYVSRGIYMIGGFRPPFGITLVLDDYAMIATVVVNALFFAVTAMGCQKIGKYTSVLLVALAGMNGMLLTGDLFNLFVFLEIVSITAYILAGASKRYEHAFHYLVLGTLGSGLLLFGIAILYAVFGSLNMADISMKMAQASMGQLALPVLLIFAGLAVEGKLLPMSGWVRGVYGNADGLTGPMFASVYAGTMLFVFGRIFGQVLMVDGQLQVALIVLGLVTLLAGEAAALSRRRVREILLYSSIGQSGLVATLFVSGLIYPAVLQLINNLLSKAVMFTISGRIADETGTDEKKVLQGIFLKHQLAGVAFTVSALSLIGLPLFLGFYSKVSLLLGAFSGGAYWIPAVILVATVIEGAYFIRLLVKLWTPGKEGQVSESAYACTAQVRFRSMQLIGVWVITLAIILSGLLPGLVQENLSPSGQLLEEPMPNYLLKLKGGL